MTEIAKKHEKCRYFNGLGKSSCEAGIEYAPLRDRPLPGHMAVWPCLTLVGDPLPRTVCSQREQMTQEEHAAERAEIDAAVKVALGRLAANLCPECGVPVRTRRVRGRCAYSDQCGHRIGQIDGDSQ